MTVIKVTILNEQDVIKVIDAFLKTNGTVKYIIGELPEELKNKNDLILEGEDTMLTAVLYDFIQSKRLKEINQVQDSVWTGWAVLICS